MTSVKKRQELPSLSSQVLYFWKAATVLQRKLCTFPVKPNVAFEWFQGYKSVKDPERVILRMQHLAMYPNPLVNIEREMKHILSEGQDASPSFADMDALSVQFIDL